MKISIISFGKFHSFDLARELSKHNDVNIYSAYPYYKSKGYNLNKKKFTSLFLLFIIDKITRQKFSLLIKLIFSLIVLVKLKNNEDIIIIWSSLPNYLLRSIKKRNPSSSIILERGSTHIKFQNNILHQEFQRFDLNFSIPKKIIDNELKNYDYSDFISVPSTFVLDTFIKNGVNQNKILLNPYGADLDKFYPSRSTNKKFQIITTGTGSIRKGLFYVLESHKLIKGDFIHYHIGNMDSELTKILKNYPKLKHVNSVNHKILGKYYRNSDVFILASLEEGLSLTILEAMASGLPIIATKNTGIETIKSKYDFKFIVDIRSPNSIAESVNYLISNPEKLKLLKSNSRKVVQGSGFTWKDYGNRYEKQLNERNSFNSRQLV